MRPEIHCQNRNYFVKLKCRKILKIDFLLTNGLAEEVYVAASALSPFLKIGFKGKFSFNYWFCVVKYLPGTSVFDCKIFKKFFE